MTYDRKQCDRLKSGLGATCRECMGDTPTDAARYWCGYCQENTDWYWFEAAKGPYCTTCGTNHGQGGCLGPG